MSQQADTFISDMMTELEMLSLMNTSPEEYVDFAKRRLEEMKTVLPRELVAKNEKVAQEQFQILMEDEDVPEMTVIVDVPRETPATVKEMFHTAITESHEDDSDKPVDVKGIDQFVNDLYSSVEVEEIRIGNPETSRRF